MKFIQLALLMAASAAEDKKGPSPAGLFDEADALRRTPEFLYVDQPLTLEGEFLAALVCVKAIAHHPANHLSPAEDLLGDYPKQGRMPVHQRSPLNETLVPLGDLYPWVSIAFHPPGFPSPIRCTYEVRAGTTATRVLHIGTTATRVLHIEIVLWAPEDEPILPEQVAADKMAHFANVEPLVRMFWPMHAEVEASIDAVAAPPSGPYARTAVLMRFRAAHEDVPAPEPAPEGPGTVPAAPHRVDLSGWDGWDL